MAYGNQLTDLENGSGILRFAKIVDSSISFSSYIRRRRRRHFKFYSFEKQRTSHYIFLWRLKRTLAQALNQLGKFASENCILY